VAGLWSYSTVPSKSDSVAIRNHKNIPFRDAVARLYDIPEAMNSAVGEVFATRRDEGDTQRAVSPHVDLLAWTESPIDSDRLYKWPVTSPCSRLGNLIVAKPLKNILIFLDPKYPLPSSQELATKRCSMKFIWAIFFPSTNKPLVRREVRLRLWMPKFSTDITRSRR